MELNVPASISIDVDAVGIHFAMVGNLVSASVFVVDDKVNKLISSRERHAYSLSNMISQRIAEQGFVVYIGKECPVTLSIAIAEQVVLVCLTVGRSFFAGKFQAVWTFLCISRGVTSDFDFQISVPVCVDGIFDERLKIVGT